MLEIPLGFRLLQRGDVVVFRGDQRHSYENPGHRLAVGYSAVLLTPLLP